MPIKDPKRGYRPRPSTWRGIVLAAVSALPAMTLGWGLSYPRFPMASAALLLLNVILLVLLAVHDGYLFLQTPDAVTDSSGIAYLPNGNQPELSGLYPDGLTALGGPWWAWTCRC